MLRAKKTSETIAGKGLRIGIAAARYNADLADALVKHCCQTLAHAGVAARNIRILRVPGSFEVSAAAAWLARHGRCDCVIGLGVILQGQTRHAAHIGAAVAHGLTEIGIATGVPTVFGIVTANSLRQAKERCLGRRYNRGHEAAETALAMARLWKSL